MSIVAKYCTNIPMTMKPILAEIKKFVKLNENLNGVLPIPFVLVVVLNVLNIISSFASFYLISDSNLHQFLYNLKLTLSKMLKR